MVSGLLFSWEGEREDIGVNGRKKDIGSMVVKEETQYNHRQMVLLSIYGITELTYQDVSVWTLKLHFFSLYFFSFLD